MKQVIHLEIKLPINKEKAWQVLWDNAYISQYMGCFLEKTSENELVWYMTKENQKIILLYGEIIEKELYERLSIKTYNPHRHYSEKLCLVVRYVLEPIKEGTKLIITQTGFESLPDGNQVYQENRKGWHFMKENLAKIFQQS